MADIGKIVGGGLRLVVERPASVLTWGILSAVAGGTIAWAKLRLMGGGDMMTALDRMGFGSGIAAVAGNALLDLVTLLVSTVLFAAALRSVLAPDQRSFAAIRLGMDELRMVAITVLLYVVGLVLAVLVGLGFVFSSAFFAMVSGGDPAVVGGMIALLVLVAIGFGIFLTVKLSLVYPLVLVRGRIGIDSSWELTSGHFWTLLGAYVLLAIVTLLASFVALIPIGVALGSRNGAATIDYWGRVAEAVAGGQPGGVPTGILLAVAVGLVLNAVFLAIWAGALATATRQVMGTAPDESAPV